MCALLLLVAAGVTAQEAPDDSGISIGTGYTFWLTDWEFESRSATRILEVDPTGGGLSGAELFGEMHLDPDWSARLGLEASFGPRMEAYVVSLGAGYRMDPFYARAGLLLGKLDMNDPQGDFDPGFGAEAGVGLRHPLPEIAEGLGLHAEIAGRFLEFGFDKDPDVLEADDGAGGFGARFTAGLHLRF